MKLAQALSERSDLQKRIAQLRVRLENNALVQEGEQPAEAPMELLQELDADFVRLEELIRAINETNSRVIEGRGTITQMLAKRDCLSKRLEIYREFLNAASRTTMRGARMEIKIISTVNVSEMRKEVDALAKELRLLESQIQELNWTVELEE